jgi:hypothetical protein
VSKLIELSSTINADLEKYDKLRKGDFAGASQVTIKPMYPFPPMKSLILSSTPSKQSANGGPTSLIDFDGELGGSQVSTSSKASSNSGNLLDDLAGLSFQSAPSAYGQGGSISLGQDTSTMHLKKPLTKGMLSSSPSNTPGRVASPAISHSSPSSNRISTPDYSAFSSLQQSLSSPPRVTSQPSQQYRPPPYTPSGPFPHTTRHTPTVSVDDEFGTFASAVPDLPPNSVFLCNSNNLSITLEATRQTPTSGITLTARFTNKQPVRLDDVTFQMAIPRVLPSCDKSN